MEQTTQAHEQQTSHRKRRRGKDTADAEADGAADDPTQAQHSRRRRSGQGTDSRRATEDTDGADDPGTGTEYRQRRKRKPDVLKSSAFLSTIFRVTVIPSNLQLK